MAEAGQSDDWDIARTYTHKTRIYSAADALTLPRHERFVFLTCACADLSRCYRKQKMHLYPIALAQAFAWFVCVADEFFRDSGGVLLATAMGEKYPADHCGYCGKLPCVCSETARAEHTSATCSPAQRTWSMHAWQGYLDSAYGDINRAGGVSRTLNRLFEEVAEVELVLHHVDGFNEPLDEVRRKIAREMSDVLAWIFGAAVLLEVDLQQAILNLYEKGCPVCRAPECICRNFEVRPHTGSLTHRFMSAEDIWEIMSK